ncbi:hypothetical protein ACH4FA_00140 [Streptomyces sp. NPDC017966]|uniref:hypothetical protein n=1 Tax=Streptomyces sp. NPDC017966 TaxID=3365023 RepID=UPI00379AA72F
MEWTVDGVPRPLVGGRVGVVLVGQAGRRHRGVRAATRVDGHDPDTRAQPGRLLGDGTDRASGSKRTRSSPYSSGSRT